MKVPVTSRCVLFAAAFLVLAAGAFWDVPSGKSVAGALVILDGGLPYRGFWTMYAPGQFYAVAGLFWLFGRELVVQALAAALAVAAAAVAFHILLVRVGASRPVAAALTAVFTTMFWTTAPELTDYQLALPFLLLALDRCVRYYSHGELKHLRWAGVWLGLAAWSKHDVAAYLAAGVAISQLLSRAIAPGCPPAWRSPYRAAGTLGIHAIAAALPMAAWTAWTAPAEAWSDLFLFPALVFRKVRGDPFPPLIPDVTPLATWLADPTHVRKALDAAHSLATWVMLYAPVALFAGGLGVLVRWRYRLSPARLGTVTLFLACMPFFWAAAHVQQNTHPYTLAILGAPAGVLIFGPIVTDPARSSRLRAPLAVAIAIYSAALMTAAAAKAAAVYYEWPGSRALDLDGFRGVRVPARVYGALHPIGEFFRTYVPPGEPIYAGLLRHDAIVINNALLYAIADRPACCGYTELHPGVADRAPIQREIVRRLETSHVRAIVLWEFGWSDAVMAARKARTRAGVPDAGSTILDRYIQDHFETLETHGEYHILWRRGS